MRVKLPILLLFLIPMTAQATTDTLPKYDKVAERYLEGKWTEKKPFEVKKMIAPAICLFVAGLSEGCMDIVDFKYWKFQKVFPKANPQFWDQNISWQNRRGQYFPFTRDAWHLFKFVNHASIMTGIVIKIGDKEKWYWKVAKGLVLWGVNRAGFQFSYKLVFKG